MSCLAKCTRLNRKVNKTLKSVKSRHLHSRNEELQTNHESDWRHEMRSKASRGKEIGKENEKQTTWKRTEGSGQNEKANTNAEDEAAKVAT